MHTRHILGSHLNQVNSGHKIEKSKNPIQLLAHLLEFSFLCSRVRIGKSIRESDDPQEILTCGPSMKIRVRKRLEESD